MTLPRSVENFERSDVGKDAKVLPQSTERFSLRPLLDDSLPERQINDDHRGFMNGDPLEERSYQVLKGENRNGAITLEEPNIGLKRKKEGTRTTRPLASQVYWRDMLYHRSRPSKTDSCNAVNSWKNVRVMLIQSTVVTLQSICLLRKSISCYFKSSG